VDAVLAKLAVAERDGGTCLGRHLQYPGHLPGNGRRAARMTRSHAMSWMKKRLAPRRPRNVPGEVYDQTSTCPPAP
jgi:hypothetical protein